MKIVIDPEKKVIQIHDGNEWTIEHYNSVFNYPLRTEDCNFSEENSEDNISATFDVKEEQ